MCRKTAKFEIYRCGVLYLLKWKLPAFATAGHRTVRNLLFWVRSVLPRRSKFLWFKDWIIAPHCLIAKIWENMWFWFILLNRPQNQFGLWEQLLCKSSSPPRGEKFWKPQQQTLLLLTQAGPLSSWPRATHYCFSITEQNTAGRHLLFSHPGNQLKNSWSFAEPLKIRAILQGAAFA